MCRPIKLLLCTEVNSYRRPFQASTNLVSIKDSNLTAVIDMTPVMSVTVSKPALTCLVLLFASFGWKGRTRTYNLLYQKQMIYH